MTTSDESGFLSPAPILVLGACAVAFGTARLVQARAEAPPAPVLSAESAEAELRVISNAAAAGLESAARTDGPGGTVAGVVTMEHPLLPERFHGVEDEILASPMLHHPPFAAEVEAWVDRWSTTFARYVPTYLERMTSFEAYVDDTLVEHGLPPSLRYLPVIESGYSPTAVSSAKAVGMWQFMAPTARDLGVEVNPLVDDRRDPYVSTAAAADYLVELRERYGSWFLALAAYNAGPERIDGLIRRWLPDVEPSDAVYWALRNVLPPETRDFVPNFLGAVIVSSDPESFGFEVPRPVPFDFDRVPVSGSVSFATIARATGMHVDEIARLNPELLRGVTPPDRLVDLRLPPGSASAFRAYFADLADRDP